MESPFGQHTKVRRNNAFLQSEYLFNCKERKHEIFSYKAFHPKSGSVIICHRFANQTHQTRHHLVIILLQSYTHK